MKGLILPKHDLRGAFDSLLPVAGASGTNTQGDVLTQTADGRDLNEVWAEFQQAVGMWNESRSRVVNLLTFGVSSPIEDVPQIATGDFEEASEFGEPKGIRGGDYFQLGYDFKWYDLAVRFTWQYLAEASDAQIASLANMAFEADNRLVFTKVLRAIFNNVNRTADIRGQNVPVYPFYNADGTVPPDYKTTTFAGSHSHYLVSGGATVDSGDLDLVIEHLTHHGYGSKQNTNMLVLCNVAQINTIKGFRVATGASYDFIPSQGSPAFLTATTTIGPEQAPSTYQGLTVAGNYGPLLIIDEDYIPAGYMVGFATGGDANISNPVGIREHQNSALRGLRLVKGKTPDYPLIDSFYQRGFGTGVRHRGAGLVMQVKASGSYDIPAAYA